MSDWLGRFHAISARHGFMAALGVVGVAGFAWFATQVAMPLYLDAKNAKANVETLEVMRQTHAEIRRANELTIAERERQEELLRIREEQEALVVAEFERKFTELAEQAAGEPLDVNATTIEPPKVEVVSTGLGTDPEVVEQAISRDSDGSEDGRAFVSADGVDDKEAVDMSRTFSVVGRQSFSLCGYDMFEAEQEDTEIVLRNRNRTVGFKDPSQFGAWSMELAVSTPTEIFPGCVVSIAGHETRGTQYMVVSVENVTTDRAEN